MRRHSLTNSNPQRNQELYDAYLIKYDFDEAHRYICEAFPKVPILIWSKAWGCNIPRKSQCIDASEAHHIHGSRKGRWDLVSELISVCRQNHVWLEDHPNEAKLICLRAKFVKAITGNPEQFDIGELSQASGYTYPSVIETYSDCGNAVLRGWREEMTEHFRGKAVA